MQNRQGDAEWTAALVIERMLRERGASVIGAAKVALDIARELAAAKVLASPAAGGGDDVEG